MPPPHGHLDSIHTRGLEHKTSAGTCSPTLTPRSCSWAILPGRRAILVVGPWPEHDWQATQQSTPVDDRPPPVRDKVCEYTAKGRKTQVNADTAAAPTSFRVSWKCVSMLRHTADFSPPGPTTAKRKRASKQNDAVATPEGLHRLSVVSGRAGPRPSCASEQHSGTQRAATADEGRDVLWRLAELQNGPSTTILAASTTTHHRQTSSLTTLISINHDMKSPGPLHPNARRINHHARSSALQKPHDVALTRRHALATQVLLRSARQADNAMKKKDVTWR
ncbi:hypothetical protein Purlil1_7671 [Purpureocillium lilacinum]|uniref:Uncharacterized protein n=1 Tax=Purpureocillium lilacinum TaxID=33203 RepID=A0ABR0BV07_PURLI|nr:hypothetical protein Purlil1_7671 [Purpureocillium lilacinum]